MAKRQVVNRVQEVLDRAGVRAKIQTEKILDCNNNGWHVNGWRATALVPESAIESDTIRRAIYDAALALGVTVRWHPHTGRLEALWCEGR